MISTTRRRILQSVGLGSPSGLRPYSASGAGRTARDAYDELGIRPVVNLQGTYTTWLAARPDGRRFPLPSYTPCNTATPGANQSHAARCGQYIGLYKPSFGVFSSFLRPEINPDEPSVFSQDSDCNRLGVLHAAQSAQFASVASEVEGIGWVFGGFLHRGDLSGSARLPTVLLCARAATVGSPGAARGDAVPAVGVSEHLTGTSRRSSSLRANGGECFTVFAVRKLGSARW